MNEADQPDHDQVLTIITQGIMRSNVDFSDEGDGTTRPAIRPTINESDARLYARAALRALAVAGYYPYTAAPTSSSGS